MIKELIKGGIGQDELLNYYNATITYVDMPIRIKGCVHCYKGIYDILINKNLSYYKKKGTIIHELAHIELNQLNQADSDLFAFNIDNYEDEANRYIEKLRKGEL